MGESLINALNFLYFNLKGRFKIERPFKFYNSCERYKMVSKESKGLVRGEYGKCPAEISDEIVKKIIGDEKRITCRPADLLKPELEQMKKECAEWIEQPEDVLSYALFGQVAVKFFEYRRAQKYKIDADLVDMENKTYPV